jgi:hypothetical protein
LKTGGFVMDRPTGLARALCASVSDSVTQRQKLAPHHLPCSQAGLEAKMTRALNGQERPQLSKRSDTAIVFSVSEKIRGCWLTRYRFRQRGELAGNILWRLDLLFLTHREAVEAFFV